MSVIRRKLILAGKFAGQTIELRGVQFTRGECVLEGPEADVDGLSCYLGKSYQALPEGSLELERAQKRDAGKENADGDGEDGSPSEPRTSDQVPGEPRSPGQGDPGEKPAEGSGDDSPETGGEELPAAGNGEQGAEISEALNRLDPEDDEDWTADDRPSVAALAELLERPDLSREEIDAAAPQFRRPERDAEAS